ncbi:MAG: SDR family oxidoreductase [Ruminococcaceae bacterium]|nr:SDR family oxidoreductase [Oscillospiraceae bacterium]
MRFSDKVAVVTGAAVGIGRATALRFAREGAGVIALDVNKEKLDELKEELLAITPKVFCAVCDVSDEEAVYSAINMGRETIGKVDILVNNAALWRDVSSFMDTATELWRRYLDINVMGTVYCTRAVLPDMQKKRWGRIINVASVAGVYGKAEMVHYSATKAALITMTAALARETVADGVLVNCISPGSVSPSENKDMDHVQPSDLSYMGRTGSDNENANLICFLASDEASYISGQNIQIDGCRRFL